MAERPTAPVEASVDQWELPSQILEGELMMAGGTLMLKPRAVAGVNYQQLVNLVSLLRFYMNRRVVLVLIDVDHPPRKRKPFLEGEC